MTENAILVDGLTKKFGDVQALDGVSFQVPRASVFGLLGPNGAGKTTAIRVLTTIIPPDSGRAEVLGFDVVRRAEAVRYLIGLAGQFAAVDPNLTGRENLQLIGRLAQLDWKGVGRRADELLERFDLQNAARRPVKTYSGGMRRRLDIAAALVQRPPVLLLDEPTTGLDLHSRNELWAMIRELVAEGTTVLLTTQYLEEADRLADDLAVVDHGRVIARGAPGHLKDRLGGTVIEIDLADDEQALVGEGAVASMTDGQPEREGATIRFTSTDGPTALIGALRSLDSRGLHPGRIAVREPSLDDVFLALTGRRAETDEAGNAETESVPESGAR